MFGSGAFVQSGGIVSNSSTVVGATSAANGILILSNGVFNIAGGITEGNNTNASGRVEVDGGLLNLSGTVTLGNSTNASAGVFVLNGGTVSNTGFNVGNVLGATGAVQVTGGQIYAAGEFFLGHGSAGKGGYATFTMSGGRILTTQRWIVGSYGTGYALLSGGEVEALRTGGSDQSLEVGRDPGTFGQLVMTGGSLKGTNELVIARDAGATGTVAMAGGDLYVQSIRRGSGLHALTLAGGTLHPYNRNTAYAFAAALTNDIGTGDTGTRFGLSALDKDGAERTVSATCTFAGNGGLAKRDAGTVTLGGALTYTGATVVEAGTLALSNAVASLASGVIEVQTNATLDVSVNRATPFAIVSGQTLRGKGTVKGAVRIASGATALGGVSGDAGTLTIDGNLTLDANSTVVFNMLGGAYSRIHVTGDVVLPAAANLTVNGAATPDTEGQAFLTWGGTLSGAATWTVNGERNPLVVIRSASKALVISYQRGTVMLVE